jgi:hypothetical protein
LSREDFEEAFKSCIVSKEVENKQALVAWHAYNYHDQEAA